MNFDLVYFLKHSNTEQENSKNISATVSLYSNEELSKDSGQPEDESIHCEVCNASYPKSLRSTHYTSIPHLIEKKSIKTTSYVLNRSNTEGYSLLEKHGWSTGKGLGKEEQGPDYPISTKRKSDKRGLGSTIKHSESSIVKVTRKRTRAEIASEQEKQTRKHFILNNYFNRD